MTNSKFTPSDLRIDTRAIELRAQAMRSEALALMFKNLFARFRRPAGPVYVPVAEGTVRP